DRTLIGQEGDDFTLTYQEWDGSEWVNSSRSIFADLTLEDFYDSLEEFLNAPLEFFSFAFLLRLPDAVNQAWDGSEWVNESRSTSVRDDQDRQISVTFDEWLEDDWVPSNRNLFTYDNGHLSTLELQEYDGESGEWVTVSVESYEYDAGDNVAVILVQYDFGLGDLQNFSRYLLTWSGSVAIGDERPSVTFALDPAYPNPFNPATVLTYHVPNGHVAVRVYSVLGRHVATLAEGVHVGGTYEVRFDGANLPSGPYIIRLEGVDRSVARVVTLVKSSCGPANFHLSATRSTRTFLISSWREAPVRERPRDHGIGCHGVEHPREAVCRHHLVLTEEDYAPARFEVAGEHHPRA